MMGAFPVFEALAKLPEPCKPESLGMDILHSVWAVQPEEHALDEEPCNPEADLIATEGKQSRMPPMLEETMDCVTTEMLGPIHGNEGLCDDGDAGTDSRHSFFSRSREQGIV
ncbi:unnamed protein product [Symbiodinium sp. CCMP2456]|nr:unnamed protein product [Symbiodinium sp. CCMP2456]